MTVLLYINAFVAHAIAEIRAPAPIVLRCVYQSIYIFFLDSDMDEREKIRY